MLIRTTLLSCLTAASLSACSSLPLPHRAPEPETVVSAEIDINEEATRYVKLALIFGRIDENYVDAYTGPEQWRTDAEASTMTLEDQYAEAVSILASLELAKAPEGEEARLNQLKKKITAMIGRMRLARGEKLSFNDEAAIIYDAIPPEYDVAVYDQALKDLNDLLPGEGPLGPRYQAMREKLIVPPENVEAVMKAAIAECRARTKSHYALPEGEKFDLEFVNNKPWGAYNWYQGNNHSLIQVNLDQPFMITRALDLGCHEGYPGHHVWNIYVENEFIKKNGWLEYQVFPLFAPAGLFGEGSANYGIELAFPAETRLAFEKEVLYPLAGLDPADGDKFESIAKAEKKLRTVNTHVGRLYLDGEISKEEAIGMIMKYRMATRSRAEQSLDFIETYRAYIINYTLGMDMVRDYIARRSSNNDEAWDVFEHLLRTPSSASDLLN